MDIEGLLEWSADHEMTDLQALIMFLVYEKKTLSLSDHSDKIDFYLQEKFHAKMNDHLEEYKKKMKINYKSNIYSIVTQKHTLYTIARSENEARYLVSKEGLEIESVSVMDEDYPMAEVDENGNDTVITIRELIKRTSKVPSILGGY